MNTPFASKVFLQRLRQDNIIMKILHRDDLPLGGFAGLREHRLVVDPGVFGHHMMNSKTWSGLGNFVYLADARFLPRGETRMHHHKEIDVISIMVEGRISHAGSLEHGKQMKANQVQVQRAGSDGFSHNEINPDDKENRMIQMWVIPEKEGLSADYKFYDLERGKMNRIYGGTGQKTFSSNTIVEVGLINQDQDLIIKGPLMTYLVKGKGITDHMSIKDGDLIQNDDDLIFQAEEEAQLITVRYSETIG